MRLIASAIILAALTGSAFAQSAPASPPTGIDVRGPACLLYDAKDPDKAPKKVACNDFRVLQQAVINSPLPTARNVMQGGAN
ncbi:MAG: hypothetical protein ACM31O_14135 [Bacteroidota bacterium]